MLRNRLDVVVVLLLCLTAKVIATKGRQETEAPAAILHERALHSEAVPECLVPKPSLSPQNNIAACPANQQQELRRRG